MAAPAGADEDAPAARSLPRPHPLSLLGERDYRSLWLSGSAFGIMRWLEMLVVGVHALAVTGSPLVVALMVVVRLSPLALFGIPIGALAERVDRRHLLAGGLAALALTSLALAGLAALDRAGLVLIALAAFLNGLLWAGEFPVRRVLIAEVAGSERIGPAMALESATIQATRMIGPALGGALYEAFGLSAVFLLGALLYGWGAWLVLRIPARAQGTGAGRGRLGADLLAGLRYVRTTRLIAAAVLLTVIINLFAFPYTAMVPVMGEQVLGLGAFAIGLLVAIDGLGALVGALALAWIAPRRQFARIYLAGTALFLAAILVFSASAGFVSAALALLLVGLGMAGFSTMQGALVLSVAPLEMRGRMMGVMTVAIGTGPIGFFVLGSLADRFGAPFALALQAGIGLALLALCALRYPELLRPLP